MWAKFFLGSKAIKALGLIIMLLGVGLIGYGALMLFTNFHFNINTIITDQNGDGVIDGQDAVITAMKNKDAISTFQDFIGWSAYDTAAFWGSLLYANETGDWLAPLWTWASIAQYDVNPLVHNDAFNIANFVLAMKVLELAGLDEISALTVGTIYYNAISTTINPLDDQWVGYTLAAVLSQYDVNTSALITAYTYYNNNLWNRIGGLDGNILTGW